MHIRYNKRVNPDERSGNEKNLPPKCRFHRSGPNDVSKEMSIAALDISEIPMRQYICSADFTAGQSLLFMNSRVENDISAPPSPLPLGRFTFDYAKLCFFERFRVNLVLTLNPHDFNKLANYKEENLFGITIPCKAYFAESDTIIYAAEIKHVVAGGYYFICFATDTSQADNPKNYFKLSKKAFEKAFQPKHTTISPPTTGQTPELSA